MKNITYLIILFFGLASCDKGAQLPSNLPQCIKSKIDQYQSAPVSNPPMSVWQYQYNGKTVYYIPPTCCDMYGLLYDNDCNRLCAPDGGITGQGDRLCPDFFQKSTDGKLIWQDDRK